MTIDDPISTNPLLDLLVNRDNRRIDTCYHRSRNSRFNVLFLWRLRPLDFTDRLHIFRCPMLHINLSLPPRTFCIIFIKIIRIPDIRSHIAIAIARPPRSVPKVKRMAMHPIRSGNDLE
jgi:hypothetical protein